MSGYTYYPASDHDKCARRGWHLYLPALVRSNSAATTLPSSWRNRCVTCGAVR